MKKHILTILSLFLVILAWSGCVEDEDNKTHIPEESALGSISYNAELGYVTATLHVGQDGPVRYIAAKNTSIINQKTIDGLSAADIYYEGGHYEPAEFMNYTCFEMANATADSISSPVLVLVDQKGNILDWKTIYTSRTRQDNFFMSSMLAESGAADSTLVRQVSWNESSEKINFYVDVAQEDVPAIIRMEDANSDKELICEIPIKDSGKHRVLFVDLDGIRDINVTVYNLNSGKAVAFGSSKGNHID